MRNADEIMLGRPVEEETHPTHEVLIEGQSVRVSRDVYELWGYTCRSAFNEYYADKMTYMYAC